MQGGEAGQNSCSAHARGATHHNHIAKAAFVAAVWTLEGCDVACLQPRAWGDLMRSVNTQVIEPNLACGISPFGGEQTGFEREKAERVA